MSRVFGSKAKVVTEPSIDPAVSTSEQTEAITCTFKDDYNIVLVHHKILAHFQQQYDSLPSKLLKLTQLEWIKANSTTVIERKMAVLEIKALEETIRLLQTQESKNSYIRQTQPLLEEYQRLASLKQERVFGAKKLVDEHTGRREYLIVRYLSISRRYIDMNVVLETHSEPVCLVCNTPLVEGASNCSNCPAFISDYESENSYKEGDRSGSSRNNYGKSGHIRDAFVEFTGKQPNRIPPELIIDLTETVKAYGIKINDLTINTLYQILRDKKYSTHYDDIYLVFHLLTGKPLPNLDDIQADLDRDADLFASIYHEIKPPDRNNCLSAHFIRDVLLRRLGRLDPEWQCTYLRTDQAIAEHNSTMRRAFLRLNWGDYKNL